MDAFGSAAEPDDLTRRNPDLAPLFIADELRIADAHESPGGVHGALTALGIDIAELNEGHGRALDRVFDAVIAALVVVEEQIDHLRGRQA